ncbi:MAG TPA: hypothetical protein DDX51_06870 [Clostridiales bacterium]|nr:hypothetical protein [Clostridiales bacterium]
MRYDINMAGETGSGHSGAPAFLCSAWKMTEKRGKFVFLLSGGVFLCYTDTVRTEYMERII